MPRVLQKSNFIIENVFGYLKKPILRSYFRKKYFLEWGLNPQKKSILGQENKNSFIRFLVQMKTVKSAFEINWPLELISPYCEFHLFSRCRLRCQLGTCPDTFEFWRRIENSSTIKWKYKAQLGQKLSGDTLAEFNCFSGQNSFWSYQLKALVVKNSVLHDLGFGKVSPAKQL